MRLELKGITKRFPGVVANDGVDLRVESGEILGLLGENGAGKTTLMNILYGLYSADEGEITVDGEPVTFSGPGDAIAAGIGMVHQHFMLVPVFTVAENAVLGAEPIRGPVGTLDRAAARARVVETSRRYRLDVDPDAVVEDLPVGVQQRVEIIKVLLREAEIIVFDEPTAVLTPQEVDEFFGIMRALRDAGKGIIFITHKLKEIIGVTDRIAVIRRGKIVGETVPAAASELELAELMVGRPVELVVEKSPARPAAPVLTVTDLFVLDDRNARAVDGVTFEVRAGEIVGVAGVQGNGQTQLVEAITGLRAPLSGSILLLGEDVTFARPREVHRLSVAHVPEDRQRSGLVSTFTVAENLVLDTYYLPGYSGRFVVDWPVVRRTAERLVDEYDIRTPSIDVPAGSLSGGNQQKVIVAREFSRDVRFVIASQPTRGLDVGSIEYIHERIVAERDRGAAILIISTELDEILALSDRILVMFRGRIVAETSPEETTTAALGLAMAGVAG